MKSLYVTLLSFGLAATLPGHGFAQTMVQKVACKDDAKKFCQGVQPGNGRMLVCLAPHKEQLSDACRLVIEKNGH